MMRWLLVALIVGPGTVGDLLTTAGMKHHGEVNDFTVRGLARLLWQLSRNLYIITGIVAMAISFFALMDLLSIAKLSFAIPATASSYLLETALAKYLLGEEVGWKRWAGASLVAIGVMLISL
ncbi:MAG TPA: EamA family transporter [Terriglobales bacterium]|nr:EamA family transporter [Terriglobales bacterium]